MAVKFNPHPIIPQLLALLEKHNAGVHHHGNGSGIVVTVNGVEVFEGFTGADLKAAAAQCQHSPADDSALASARALIVAAKDDDRVKILSLLGEGYCLHCGSSDGQMCYCRNDQ